MKVLQIIINIRQCNNNNKINYNINFIKMNRSLLQHKIFNNKNQLRDMNVLLIYKVS